MAGMLSGARATFIMIPFLLLLVAILDLRNWRISWWPVLAVLVAVLLVISLLERTLGIYLTL